MLRVLLDREAGPLLQPLSKRTTDKVNNYRCEGQKPIELMFRFRLGVKLGLCSVRVVCVEMNER